MQRFFRPTALLVILVLVFGLALIDAGAQTRRKRRARRVPRPVITNPVINPPEEQTASPNETRVLSTADETTAETTSASESAKSKRKRSTADSAGDSDDMQQTIHALSNQVNRLTDKLGQMQDNDRALLDMERLTRAEQRAESLRAQQIDVESKLADVQSKLETVEYALKPENIDRVTSGYGTTRPEEARETRRRQLESERARLQVQVRILETSRTRLETAVANADAEVDMLRRRVQLHDTVTPAAEAEPARSPKPE